MRGGARGPSSPVSLSFSASLTCSLSFSVYPSLFSTFFFASFFHPIPSLSLLPPALPSSRVRTRKTRRFGLESRDHWQFPESLPTRRHAPLSVRSPNPFKRGQTREQRARERERERDKGKIVSSRNRSRVFRHFSRERSIRFTLVLSLSRFRLLTRDQKACLTVERK